MEKENTIKNGKRLIGWLKLAAWIVGCIGIIISAWLLLGYRVATLEAGQVRLGADISSIGRNGTDLSRRNEKIILVMQTESKHTSKTVDEIKALVVSHTKTLNEISLRLPR